MYTVRFYLDRRTAEAGKPAPLKIGISNHGSTTYLNTGVKLLPSNWNSTTERVMEHPQKVQLNMLLSEMKLRVQNAIETIRRSGNLHRLTLTQLKRKVADMMENNSKGVGFTNFFEKIALTKKAASTQSIYLNTLKKIRAFDRDADILSFENITKQWLDAFEAHLIKIGNKTNTISIDLRNIRAVFNEALDEEITTCYPFRKKRIKSEATPKRSLSVENLRELFYHEVEPYQQRYLDIFKLSFFLIGINLVDLVALTHIEDGRINYKRAKTGRSYSIKVEEEAYDIIREYPGKKRLLSFGEGFASYKTLTLKIDRGLKEIGTTKVEYSYINEGGTLYVKQRTTHIGDFPKLSYYWARHSWATIAAELDIPKETIAAALGHGGNTVTDIYIDFNQRKIDEANRKVIDYVMYGRR